MADAGRSSTLEKARRIRRSPYPGTTTLDPFAGAHHRLRTRCSDTVHIDVIRSDHPVNMNQAFVRASRRELFWSEAIAIFQACAVGLSEGDVAGGILVEESVHEEQSAGRYR